MSQETVVYLINLLIGVILAGVMSQFWRLESSGQSLHLWILAVWTLTGADLLFVARSMLPPDAVPRVLPTITVTAGHALLVLAAQRSAERTLRTRWIAGVVLLHLLVLLAFRWMPAWLEWRAAANSLVWGALSVTAALVLWNSGTSLRELMRLPALVLGAQGLFHTSRSLLATHAVTNANAGQYAAVQMLGDVEVSLFMVALFVGVLVAYLRQSTTELRLAHDNVQALSSMLPLCAWCKNVRDDDGYWRRIEEYLSAHQVNVTHGMCESCATEHFGRRPPSKS